MLLDDPGAVFSAGTRTERDGTRIRTGLSVDLGAGASVRQDVMARLGATRSTETGLIVPVAWQAVGRERLFPTFDGELGLSETDTGTRLRLAGVYAVPLGVLGRFGNGVVGWRLAQRSLSELLERLAGRVESEVDRRRRSTVQRRPHPAAPPAWERSELYIG